MSNLLNLHKLRQENINNIAPVIIQENDVTKAQSHDSEEISGTINLTSPDLELNWGGGPSYVGVYFDGFTIPAGATITNAYIEFNPDVNRTGTVSITIQGQKGTNPGVFTTTSFDVSNRADTTAVVAWNNIPDWTANTINADTTTPDLSSIVQEIVDDPSYTSNDNIVIIFVPGAGTNRRSADNYLVEAQAPHMFIDYFV